MTTLNSELANAVLSYLRVTPAAPDVTFLDTLMTAYIRRVPWESVSRIAKRARTPETAQCPRFAEEFWQSALENGTGGTCFESNYAFFALLRSLGYDGYLTINDMLTTRGCHTAIILNIDGEQWLTDAGYPVHQALRIDAAQATERAGHFHTYTATPESTNQYRIERDKHPKPYCFTLLNTPVVEPDYRAATTNDYGEDGLFLDKVIVTRVVDEQIYRFIYMNSTLMLESFDNSAVRTEQPLGDDAAETVAQRFDMNPALIAAALQAVP